MKLIIDEILDNMGFVSELKQFSGYCDKPIAELFKIKNQLPFTLRGWFYEDVFAGVAVLHYEEEEDDIASRLEKEKWENTTKEYEEAMEWKNSLPSKDQKRIELLMRSCIVVG